MKDISYSAGYSYKGRLFIGVQYDFMYEYFSNIIYFPESSDLIHQIGFDLDYALLKQSPGGAHNPSDKKAISVNIGASYKINEIVNAIAAKLSFSYKIDWADRNWNFDPYRGFIFAALVDYEFYQHKREYFTSVPILAMNLSLEGAFMFKKFVIFARYTFHIPESLSDQYLFEEYGAVKFGVGYLIPLRFKKRAKKSDFEMDVFNSGTE